MARRNAPAESSGRRDARPTNASAAGPFSKPACLHQETKSAYEFRYSRVVAPRFPPTVLAKSRHGSPATSWNLLEALAGLATVLTNISGTPTASSLFSSQGRFFGSDVSPHL